MMKKEIKLIEELLIDELRKDNPYPEDIFIEPTKEQHKLIQKLFKKNNLSLDGYNGSFGRKVWNNCVDCLEIKQKELGENNG